MLDEIRTGGVTQAELERAKKSYLAEYIYESDNQTSLARRYGWSLTVGRTLQDIEQWPARISKVTLDDVKKVATKYLDIRHSVTGTLIPIAPEPTPKAEGNPQRTPSRG